MNACAFDIQSGYISFEARNNGGRDLTATVATLDRVPAGPGKSVDSQNYLATYPYPPKFENNKSQHCVKSLFQSCFEIKIDAKEHRI